MTRDDLADMLGEQTGACGPARDALIAGGAFVVWDGLLPADRLAHTYRVRLRHTLRRGHTVEGLAATVGILEQAGEELLRIGCIDAVDKSFAFTLFLNAAATAVVACAGGTRSGTTHTPVNDPEIVAEVVDHHVGLVRGWSNSFAKTTESAFRISFTCLNSAFSLQSWASSFFSSAVSRSRRSPWSA
ncbi:hypothetical protein [Streptomyces herbicida]|uniref:hypothetical protein n=1 Tax=Streptomyces herbicida TaxID=3065675 RepID=UPI00292FE4D3|nr:hypothetical protein [Streptomyces sp. NEAU-HV9]